MDSAVTKIETDRYLSGPDILQRQNPWLGLMISQYYALIFMLSIEAFARETDIWNLWVGSEAGYVFSTAS